MDNDGDTAAATEDAEAVAVNEAMLLPVALFEGAAVLLPVALFESAAVGDDTAVDEAEAAREGEVEPDGDIDTVKVVVEEATLLPEALFEGAAVEDEIAVDEPEAISVTDVEGEGTEDTVARLEMEALADNVGSAETLGEIEVVNVPVNDRVVEGAIVRDTDELGLGVGATVPTMRTLLFATSAMKRAPPSVATCCG